MTERNREMATEAFAKFWKGNQIGEPDWSLPVETTKRLLVTMEAIAGAARAEGRRETKTSWRCFHCDETFTDREDALIHFGFNQMTDAACQIDIKAFREMEECQARHLAEDSDMDRAMHRMRAEHDAALRREEERGYAKGLQDGRREAIEKCAKISDDQARLADEDGNPDAVAACRIAARRQRALA